MQGDELLWVYNIAAPTIAKETYTQIIYRITGQYIGQTNRNAGLTFRHRASSI